MNKQQQSNRLVREKQKPIEKALRGQSWNCFNNQVEKQAEKRQILQAEELQVVMWILYSQGSPEQLYTSLLPTVHHFISKGERSKSRQNTKRTMGRSNKHCPWMTSLNINIMFTGYALEWVWWKCYRFISWIFLPKTGNMATKHNVVTWIGSRNKQTKKKNTRWKPRKSNKTWSWWRAEH